MAAGRGRLLARKWPGPAAVNKLLRSGRRMCRSGPPSDENENEAKVTGGRCEFGGAFAGRLLRMEKAAVIERFRPASPFHWMLPAEFDSPTRV